MGRVVFSAHALDRLRRRGVSKTRVVSSIKSYDDLDESYRGRKVFRKKFKSGELEVVAVEEDGRIVVITAYYLIEQ